MDLYANAPDFGERPVSALSKADMLILAREGRAWLMETCMSILTEAEVKHMPPARVELWVDRRYEGGWAAFKRDNAALLSE